MYADCTIDGVKDIVFVIDSSYNYFGSQVFQVIREFVDNITISVKLNSPESSVGVILFNDYAYIEFDLDEYANLSAPTTRYPSGIFRLISLSKQRAWSR